MIAITKPEIPEFLSNPLKNKKWITETENAIKHYSSLPPKVKAFSFKAYNDEELKDELKKVFTKCAYCESIYGHVYDGDIEHFRPKGSVSDKNPKSPGYYWLANDWDNLLLSCQHCNQRRKHLLGTKKVSLGKQDQFPLSDENTRVSSHLDTQNIKLEKRLLLNPCIDSPEKHFEYDTTLGVMIPKTDMGRKSVEVYALRRPNLVEARFKILEKLFNQLNLLKIELEKMNDHQDNKYDEWFEKVKLQFASNESEYAGMGRFFIRKFLKENNII